MSYMPYGSRRLLVGSFVVTLTLLSAACAGNATPEQLNAGSSGTSTATTQSTGSGNPQSFTYDPNFTSTLVGGDWNNTDTATRFLADFDGDGLADLMALDANWLYYSKNIASAFIAPQNLRNDFSAAKGWTSEQALPRMFGDVNGDGKMDIIGCGYDNLVVNTSDGSTTTGQASFNALTMFTYDDGYVSQDVAPRFVADVDGDGKADLIGINPNGVRVGLSTGSVFTTPTVWSHDFVPAGGWISQSATPRMFADVNGDGKADLVGFGLNGVAVALSTGSSFAAAQVVSMEFVGSDWPSNNSTPRFAADINGDGLADFIAIDSDGVHVALGSVSMSGTETVLVAEPSYIAYVGFRPSDGWGNQVTTPRFVADVNGDKKADLLGFSSTALNVVLAP